jgi:DNA repair exonuclease SbcCD ATPase subunit
MAGLVFETIRWRNLLSTGNAWVEIDLSIPGSYLITGEMGSGKSSLADAITFGLYGRPYRRINKPQLINSINKKDCVVEVTFKSGSSSYLVRRGLKPAIFEVYCNNKLLNQNADSRDYQEEFEAKVLRMSLKAFKQYVIIGSTSYVPFMELKADDRRKVVEDLLDVEIFTSMNKLLLKRIQGSRERFREVDFRIESARERIKLIRKNIDRFMQNTAELVDQKKMQIVDLKAKGLQAVLQGKEIEQQLTQLNKEVSLSTTSIRSRWEKSAEIKSKIQHKQRELTKDIEFFGHTNECPTCRQSITESYKNSAVSKRSRTLQDLNAALIQIDQRIDLIRKEQIALKLNQDKVSDLSTNFAELKTVVRMTKNNIESIQNEINQLKTQKNQYNSDEDQIDELNTVLKEYLIEKKSLHEDQELQKIAQLLLKDSGLKAQIIKKYIPIINKFINKYLSAMDLAVNFEIDENFNEIIKSRHRDEYSFFSFSEGEKFRIDASIMLTWRAICRVRNSASCSILLLDETFDSALDDNGIELFSKIISDLTDEGVSTVIISHRGQVSDMFDNHFHFKKVRNFSQMDVQ